MHCLLPYIHRLKLATYIFPIFPNFYILSQDIITSYKINFYFNVIVLIILTIHILYQALSILILKYVLDKKVFS